MTAESDMPRPTRKNLTWSSFAMALFVVVLVVLLYSLGLSMVHHRFFRGGRINPHGRLVQ